ncbi:MAG: Ig-like domain-containing protein [Bacteroidales bacterium]
MRIRSVSRWRPRLAPVILAVFAVGLIAANTVRLTGQASTTGWKLVAWNNLGMHCMDADFSVFSILPPYNTIQAQLIDSSGKLVKTPGSISVTYQGVADPSGSINTTAAGKTNFWTFVQALFGAALPPDNGLVGNNMPGPANLAQPMAFDANLNWFIAEGIPITPYDDDGKKNYYPLMLVTATDGAGATIASTKIVLPVSDEMDCRACHASGSGLAARPSAGWVVNEPDPQREYRLNILRLHDERQFGTADATKLATYKTALQAKGYSSAGLYATATGTGTAAVPAAPARAILCANCHLSEALKGSGYAGIPPLTAAIHSQHSAVVDPTNGLALDSTANRSACYRCHPGSETRCLRGTMGNAVASDGSMAIQCQNCHGKMSAVGAPTRTGWLDEPSCQNCHSGTASQNTGEIRYVSAFDSKGQPRTPATAVFATQASTLYRFSAGHGGLQCSACHGSTHAEYPSSHPNDNIQSLALQGHVGTISECSTCHGQSLPSITTSGPHGMHPLGASWVTSHHDANKSGCQACHGTDYRGTVLSRAFGNRTLNTVFGTKTLFRGAQVGCYMCHNGPYSSSPTTNRPPSASNVSATSTGAAVALTLKATDPDGNPLTYRIVSQPSNGTVGLSGSTATYFPYAGFTGTDAFTYTAWDGSVDSNLGTATISVAAPPSCTVSTSATVATTGTTAVPVQFNGSATPSNCSGSVAYDWDFGDGTPHASTASTTHTYAAARTFTWTFTATVDGVKSVQWATISITAPAGPMISVVTGLSNPFRIQIDGANFQQGAVVYIGGSKKAWSHTQFLSSQQLLLSGRTLSSLFPSGVAVGIQVVNPDGQSASTTFTRR